MSGRDLSWTGTKGGTRGSYTDTGPGQSEEEVLGPHVDVGPDGR